MFRQNSGVQRARSLSEYLNSTLAIVDHADDASTEGGYVIGDVQGKTCIMVDDILNTGATLARAANVLKKTAQRSICLCVTWIIVRSCESILDNAPIKDICITDSVSQKKIVIQKT